MDFLQRIMAIYKALDKNDLNEAERIVSDAETELSSLHGGALFSAMASLGGGMIDLGSDKGDGPLIVRGMEYTSKALSKARVADAQAPLLYNLANGSLALWDIRAKECMAKGSLDCTYIEAKKYFRQAIDLVQSHDLPIDPQLFVNYGNCLDSVSRRIDAVAWYDKAIKIDDRMPLALGNKAMTLYRLARLARGHTHSFLLEAKRLLEQALSQPLEPHSADVFQRYYDAVSAFFRGHGEMEAEKVHSTKSISEFHTFLRNFCLHHELYLTPSTLVGKDNCTVYGDPMFISGLVASIDDDEKFDRYITFLNQIKQDYVLARYFLVQSQYQSNVVEAIDRDVELYYPLDYSIYSSYIEMLKLSARLAVDVLDKVAYFAWDYCKVGEPEEDAVNFRNLWSTRSNPLTLRPQLASIGNNYLFALLDLSLELRKEGHLEAMYNRRNSLTHKFLVVHDMILPSDSNADIPRIEYDDFLEECIETVQLARAAVMYLIMFVDSQEAQAADGAPTLPIEGTPVDDLFRWVPRCGD
jgi:hypothetical protein